MIWSKPEGVCARACPGCPLADPEVLKDRHKVQGLLKRLGDWQEGLIRKPASREEVEEAVADEVAVATPDDRRFFPSKVQDFAVKVIMHPCVERDGFFQEQAN